MRRTIIRSTGRHLPPRLITNEDLTQWMDTSDEWIRQRTGVEQRYWVDEGSGTGPVDLGFEASKIALERAGWSAGDLDLIIFATLNPDIFFPGSGCLLQHKLGLTSTPALDIRQQCTGFLYGLSIADAYIRSSSADKILLVGSEVHSTGLDISNRGRDVTVIFGDGAGAVCIESIETDDTVGVLATALHSQGEYADILCLEAPTARVNGRITKEMIDEGLHYTKMDGKAVFKLAVRRLPEVAFETLEQAGLSKDDIDLYIPHQANLRINQFFQKSMGLPDGKVFNNIQRYGNTTAATIPIALDEAIEKKIVGKGSTVLFLGLGSGVTWGSVIYRFEGKDV